MPVFSISSCPAPKHLSGKALREDSSQRVNTGERKEGTRESHVYHGALAAHQQCEGFWGLCE